MWSGGIPWFQVVWLLDAGAFGKTIRKDLVENGILHPLRGNDIDFSGLSRNNGRLFFHSSFSFVWGWASPIHLPAAYCMQALAVPKILNDCRLEGA